MSSGATRMHLAFGELGLGFTQTGVPVPEIPVEIFGFEFFGDDEEDLVWDADEDDAPTNPCG
mgnify:CR=1 FL=1